MEWLSSDIGSWSVGEKALEVWVMLLTSTHSATDTRSGRRLAPGQGTLSRVCFKLSAHHGDIFVQSWVQFIAFYRIRRLISAS